MGQREDVMHACHLSRDGTWASSSGIVVPCHFQRSHYEAMFEVAVSKLHLLRQLVGRARRFVARSGSSCAVRLIEFELMHLFNCQKVSPLLASAPCYNIQVFLSLSCHPHALLGATHLRLHPLVSISTQSEQSSGNL